MRGKLGITMMIGNPLYSMQHFTYRHRQPLMHCFYVVSLQPCSGRWLFVRIADRHYQNQPRRLPFLHKFRMIRASTVMNISSVQTTPYLGGEDYGILAPIRERIQAVMLHLLLRLRYYLRFSLRGQKRIILR